MIKTLLNTLACKTLARGINDRVERTIRTICAAAANAFGEVKTEEGKFWFRLAKYGEYPVQATLPNGTRREMKQVVDKKSGEEMGRRLAYGINTIADMFRGLPIYEGHPDDAGWLAANPGYKKIAVGRIKKIEARDDGIWAYAAMNEQGVALISGEAAPLSAISPNWGMVNIDGRPDAGHVVQLFSAGLVERSNIPGNTIGLNEVEIEISQTPDASSETETTENTTMLTPETLAALGLKPDATADEINAAIAKLVADTTAAKTKATAEEAKATAANDALKKLRDTTIDSQLTSAVNDGRITEAEKPTWKKALEADYDAEAAKLAAKMPTASALNSQDHVTAKHKPATETAGLGGGITAINDAVKSYAAEHKIDIGTATGWDTAFNATKAAKPELFK